MDLTSLLIGIGFLAIFLFPVFLIHRANKRITASNLEGFKKQAQNHGINLLKYDNWNEQFIGVDTNKRKVFFLKDIKNNSSGLVIELDDFVRCKINTESIGGKNNSDNGSLVNRISLVLISRNQKSPDMEISFFDKSVNTAGNNEFELAKRWEANINNAMKG